MPTIALIDTCLKVTDERADIRQVILKSLLDLFLTSRHLLDQGEITYEKCMF